MYRLFGPSPTIWVEVKKENVVDFLHVHIIYRFGIQRYILTDNGKPFDNNLMDKICKLFDFKQRNSSAYYAAANGLAEVFNKTLCNLLKKVISKSKRDWHDRMEEALWAYRTTHRTPTQNSPYSLVYGVEAVLPLERQIPSLRLVVQEGLTDEENAKLRLAELEVLDENVYKRNKAWSAIKLAFLEVYTSGAHKLISEDGVKIGPINGRFLKLYYP
ncbi:PREDICTED: uncharacterized protein LOC109159921 [Ipomoea nil]|uniref:uncharacterized protein LOC109159921 n=1 Tax=Ipomoea nil TaxID=35883 RepID=UPI000901BB5C|nr:PREDICTED: uncharacterized protein LOC109159921 [Ipomoea nil]